MNDFKGSMSCTFSSKISLKTQSMHVSSRLSGHVLMNGPYFNEYKEAAKWDEYKRNWIFKYISTINLL